MPTGIVPSGSGTREVFSAASPSDTRSRLVAVRVVCPMALCGFIEQCYCVPS
jgi:hypothetical protein